MEATFRRWKRTIDASLDAALPFCDKNPRLLHEAMRYAVFPGGKRIRPLLVLAAAFTVDRVKNKRGKPAHAKTQTGDCVVGSKLVKMSMPPAIAIELIHSYSLVHDDLPSMDNDDLRRGLPTVHKAFGEAEAILVGDALLSLAFEAVSNEEACQLLGYENSAKIVRELAQASGSLGMVGGQVMDISPVDSGIGLRHVEELSDLKTGALIRAAIRCGALVAGAGDHELKRLTRFGELFGRGFQVRDDLKDMEKEETLTFPGVLGPEEAKSYISGLLSFAIDILKPYEEEARELLWLATATLDVS